MNEFKIMIADDDTTFCLLACDLLRREGYEATAVHNSEQCLREISRREIHILMLDMCFPALKDGFDTLERVREDYPHITILMISGEGNIPDAVSAIKKGAADFIEKPIAPEHLLLRLKTVTTRMDMEDKIKHLSHTAIGMIGISKSMQKVFGDIIRAAQYDCPILITGETGVGKELATRAIHRLSKVHMNPLVIINCGAIPKELFESELFGHESGAFTGANKARKGYFEHARGGAVFLDEVSELPLEVQVKLLRVLSEGEIQKVGGKIEKINSRIYSASNHDLPSLIKKGLFRDDLYYRLNTINIHIPPLRERKEDILPLAHSFINQVCAENSIPPLTLSPQASMWLMEQEWKGNVRELKNCIYRGVVFANSDQITVASLQTDDCNYNGQEITESLPLRVALKKYEKSYIMNCLKAFDYSVPQTAKAICMDKSNLFKRIKSLGIELKCKNNRDS
ncbi:MAG: sigma-54 dependent transcriptional regulator [Candidatus Cloacimonadaceae bacterium]|nr:sigma-54 dependent transcriptional regulator [Candidatus Cloacimonadaceae bacterium]